MEPGSDSNLKRFVAWCGGFLVGIGAEILFLLLINRAVGPVVTFWSKETLLLVVILSAPLVLSRLFLRIETGTPKESFFKAFQLGVVAWFIKVVVTLMW